MRKETRHIEASSHFCIYCAAEAGGYVDAAKIVFDDDTGKCLPLCNDCFNDLEMEEKTFFSVFSKN